MKRFWEWDRRVTGMLAMRMLVLHILPFDTRIKSSPLSYAYQLYMCFNIIPKFLQVNPHRKTKVLSLSSKFLCMDSDENGIFLNEEPDFLPCGYAWECSRTSRQVSPCYISSWEWMSQLYTSGKFYVRESYAGRFWKLELCKSSFTLIILMRISPCGVLWFPIWPHS